MIHIHYNKQMHYYVLTEKMAVLSGTHTTDYKRACYLATQLVHRDWKTEKERKAIVRRYVMTSIKPVKEEQ